MQQVDLILQANVEGEQLVKIKLSSRENWPYLIFALDQKHTVLHNCYTFCTVFAPLYLLAGVSSAI